MGQRKSAASVVDVAREGAGWVASKTRRRRGGAMLASAALVLLVAVAGTASEAAAAGGTVVVYRTPASHAFPANIAVAPGGDLWFTEFATGAVVRMTPAGSMKSFRVGPAAMGIVHGPDGLMWVSAAADLFGVSSSGRVRTIADPDRSVTFTGPNDIGFSGKDSLYVTGINATGRYVVDRVVTTTGTLTTVASFPSGEELQSLAAGPRCGVWVAISRTSASGSLRPPLLDRLAQSGVAETIPLRRSDTPNGMVCGPGGALWVADGASLLRVARDGRKLRRFPLLLPRFSSFVSATAVAVSPHGDVWFVGDDGLLGERSPRGTFSYWRIPAGASGGLAVDGVHGVFTLNETRSEIVVLR